MSADLQAQFVEAFRRQLAMMFDNLGIHVNMSKLPSAEKLRAARQELYGTHWLSRLYCRKIRPYLYPEKHRGLVRDVDTLEGLQRIEFLNEVLKQGKSAGYIE
jgi:hypothetical protein